MSNAREPPRCHVELAVSKRFIVLLSVGHLGALVTSTILAVSSRELLFLCLAVVLSWLWAIERHALQRSPRAFVALELEGERSCALQMRNGEWVYGTIEDSSYVLPWLIILHVAIEGRMLGVRAVLFADSMTQESHRRLRMRLRWIRDDKLEMEQRDAPL